MKTKDMTDKQFLKALERHGFRLEGFMGYVKLPIEGHHICVSIRNGGTNHRAQLAYLLRELDRYRRETEAKALKDAGAS